MAEHGLVLSTVQLPFVRILGAFGSLRKVSFVDAECNDCSKRGADEQHDAGVDEKFPHISFLVVGLMCIATCLALPASGTNFFVLDNGAYNYRPTNFSYVTEENSIILGSSTRRAAVLDVSARLTSSTFTPTNIIATYE